MARWAWRGMEQPGYGWRLDSTGGITSLIRRVCSRSPCEDRFARSIAIQHPLLWEETGTLVDETVTMTGPSKVLFLRVDTLGQVVDTASILATPPRFRTGLPGISTMIRGRDAFRFLTRHYLASGRWSMAPDGSVWSAMNGRLRLVKTDSNGDTLRIVETSHRPESFDRRDREAISKGLAEAGLSRQDVELVRPLVSEIYVMDDGHILVGIFEQVGEDPSTFDVFDPGGVLPRHHRSGNHHPPAQPTGARRRYARRG